MPFGASGNFSEACTCPPRNLTASDSSAGVLSEDLRLRFAAAVLLPSGPSKQRRLSRRHPLHPLGFRAPIAGERANSSPRALYRRAGLSTCCTRPWPASSRRSLSAPCNAQGNRARSTRPRRSRVSPWGTQGRACPADAAATCTEHPLTRLPDEASTPAPSRRSARAPSARTWSTAASTACQGVGDSRDLHNRAGKVIEHSREIAGQIADIDREQTRGRARRRQAEVDFVETVVREDEEGVV